MFITPAYAQGIGGGSGLGSFLPIILIFVVFYFLLIRPQQTKMKKHRAMLSMVKRGDRVLTGGGIQHQQRVVRRGCVLLGAVDDLRRDLAEVRGLLSIAPLQRCV